MNAPAACCAVDAPGVVSSLMADRALSSHFQPIVRLADGLVFAHEALVRGPVGTPLQQPDALFKAAAEEGQTLRLENACVAVALKCWSAHAVGGKLFVNVSADAMVSCLQHTALQNLAIVEDERPVGLIHRNNFMDQYGKPFFRELYGRKSCIVVANTAPLVLDKHTGIAQLTDVLTSEDQRYLRDGFIVTEQGRYIGVGTGDMLVRSVTEIRVEAARHANPLTFLPGNIPITEHVDRLLVHGVEFVAAYVDLNNFKPFNDQYGYWRGDEVIQLAARAVTAHCDPRRDFVGHVGGDDFVVLFQSEDWLQRCDGIVAQFNETVQTLYDEADLRAGGFEAEDRHGEMRFFPLTTMSIGVKRVRRNQFTRAEQVASAAAEAKRAAKRDGVGVLIQ